MFKIRDTKTTGIASATSVAVLQGFEGILFLFFGLVFSKVMFQSFSFSTVTLAVKEIITISLLICIVRPRRVIELCKRMIKSKDARLYFIAGSVGTTTGNLLYILAIQYAGSGYGVILTALYPIFSIILVRYFTTNDDPFNRKVIIGVIISVLSTMSFVAFPAIFEGGAVKGKTIAGMLIGGAASFFWAFEALFLKKAMKRKANKDLAVIDGVTMRSIAATMTSCLLLVPLSSILHASAGGDEFKAPSKVFEILVTNWESILLMSSIAANLFILRLLHLKAIFIIGPRLTAIIDTNNFLIPSLMSIFLQFTDLTFKGTDSPLFEPPVWWAWFLIIPILLGVTIVLYYNREKEKEIIEPNIL